MLTYCSDFSTIKLDATTLTVLFAQQSMIETLGLGPIVIDLGEQPRLNAFGSNPWTRLRELKVPSQIWSEVDLDVYRDIICKAHRLSRLSIKPSRVVSKGRRISIKAEAQQNMIFAKLFAKGNIHFGHQLNPLLSLHLDQVDITAAVPWLREQFDSWKLQELCVSDCEGWSTLLKAVAEDFRMNGSHLRLFSLHHLSRPDVDWKGVIEYFLGSFHGLNALRYTNRHYYDHGERALDLRCLDSHLRSLEQLVFAPGAVGNQSSRESGISDQYIAKVTSGCPNLRQLGMLMPPCSSSGETKNQQRYADTLRQTLALPNLRTLRIFNWPDPEHIPLPSLPDRLQAEVNVNGIASEIEDFYYDDLICNRQSTLEQRLNDFVAKILTNAFRETGKGCGSPVIYFHGLSDDFTFDEDGLQIYLDPACYVPIMQSDTYGRAAIIAQKISITDAKYLEPEHEILEGSA